MGTIPHFENIRVRANHRLFVCHLWFPIMWLAHPSGYAWLKDGKCVASSLLDEELLGDFSRQNSTGWEYVAVGFEDSY